MQDKELYQQILGLESPWRVADVSVDVAEQEIVVAVEHAPGTRFCCPECGLELPCCDYSGSRDWRHLDSCQFKTILWAALPRSEWPIPRARHWLEYVNEPQCESELASVRRSVARGTPSGLGTWVTQFAARLQMEHTLRPRGRPKAKQ